MNNTNIAWTRTTFTSLWLGLSLWVSAKLGWELDPENPTAIIIVGLTGGVVWRLSELLANIKFVGYVLFGINKEPGYDLPAPPNPPVPDEPPRDAGLSLIETIVLMVVVALAIYGVVVLLS